MQRTSDTEVELIIQLYCDGLKVADIAAVSGRCVTTVKKILRKSGYMRNAQLYADADMVWIRRHFPGRSGWNIPEPTTEEPGPYRKVHPGDKGIRTQYKPDGKFR